MARKTDSSLTDIQAQILQVIMQSKSNSGIIPSMREIAELVGLSSVASVSYQLDNLEEKGYIRRQEVALGVVEIRLFEPSFRAFLRTFVLIRTRLRD